jgi:hypothetical protein
MIKPTVYVEAPEDMSDNELQANADVILRVMRRTITNDGGVISDSYRLTIEREGDDVRISAQGFGDVAGTVEDTGSLNIGEWFNSGEAQ